MPIPPYGSPPPKVKSLVAGTGVTLSPPSGTGNVTINSASGASITAASIQATFTTAGQLYVGTGAGTGELLPSGSSGKVLAVGGADPSGLQWAVPTGIGVTVSGVPGASGQVLESTSSSVATWQTPTVNQTSALGLSLTETVNYPPTSPLNGNTALWIQQNETFSSLPTVQSISGNGTIWTVTFVSSILGTLGQVGDTFACWTVDFLPSGWNVGNQYATVTATVTGATTITIPQAFSTTATQLGTVQPFPVQSTGGFFGDRSILQVEGTNTFARPPNSVDGIGPVFQSTMIYEPATSVTATFTLTSGSNLATISGLPPAGIFVGMNVIDLTNTGYLPLGTVVGNVYYTIGTTTTTITLLNKYSGAAQNPVGLGSTSSDSLSFCCDVLSAEQFITGSYTKTHGQSTQMVPNFGLPNANVPGASQNWGQGYWSGSAWLGDTSGNTLTAVQQADFISVIYTGANANIAEWVGFSHLDVAKPTGTTSGSLGMQIGFAAGLWTGISPIFGVAAADNGTALSALGTLTVVTFQATYVIALLPQQGSGVIFASDGMHAFNWTGITGSTFTGCTYSGNQAATVATGNPVQINPQFLTSIFGANNIGMLNASTTAYPAQCPIAQLTSATNGVLLTSVPLASSTVAAGSNGTALSALSSLVLASTASFGTSGTGVLIHSSLRYIFTWTGNNTGTNTLTGCVFSGLQTVTVSTGDAVTGGGVVPVNSVQWFPDDGGTLYVSEGSGAVGQMTYLGTTATYVASTSTATALSSLGTLTVTATSFLPVAGTAILYTSGGPQTVTWTGIGSATTLTGCTYSGSTANTVINGSQLFLATTTTGPTGLGPAFFGCASVPYSDDVTLVTGMTVLAAPGGTFQATALPASSAPLICIGPGFQLPQVNATKMAIFAAFNSTAALGVPTFAGLNPAAEMELRIVVSRAANSSTITFESNGSSSGTLMSLGAATRAVATGGSLLIGWDANSRTAGEWIEYSVNTGGHG